MLSRLTLRQKLIIVLAIPMVVLAILAALRINAAFDDRTVAENQQDEVDRTVALFQLANTVRAERDIVLLGGGTENDLQVRRSNVDNTLARLSVPEAGYNAEVRQGLIELGSALATQREAIGDSMDGIRQDAIASGEAAEVFDELASSTLALVDFNEDLVVDPETSQQLATLQLAVEFNESLNREALIYFRTSTLSRPQQTSRVLRDAADRGQRSSQLEETLDQLATDVAADRFATVTAGEQYQQFIEVRDSIADAAVRNRAIDPLGVEVLSAFGVRPELESYQGELLSNVLNDASDAQSNAQNALWRTIALAALIGLAVSLLMFALYRSIRRPLRRLTDSALHIAEEELPNVVAIMRSAETADDSAFEVTPLKSETEDEIGQLVDSFNKLHVTAVDLAAEQAQSRRTASDMFANLGRRNQRLLTQALDEMDDLERDEQNPERLDKLFSIDQKITRMRRNAESLLVLAGQHTPRQWSEPAPVSDVIRAAMSEVENFDRISVRPGDDVLIKGAVVADLTHLLAELLENALRFSPPSSPVEVGAHLSGGEAVVVVIDRGVGLDEKQRQAFTELISAAATSEETPSKRLGHYVVGRLGARHGIQVELREDPVTRGTVARVVLGPAVATEKDFGNNLLTADQPISEAAIEAAPATYEDDLRVLTAVPHETSPIEPVPAAAFGATAGLDAVPATPAELFDSLPVEVPESEVLSSPTMGPAPATSTELIDFGSAPEIPPAAGRDASLPARRVPGANFGTEPAERNPAEPAQVQTQPAQPAQPAQPTRTEQQARRLAAKRNLDRRPLPPIADGIALARQREQRAMRSPGAPSTSPAPRVPGQNLPAQLRNQRTPQHAVPEAAADDSYWDAFASFQDSSSNSQKDNS